MAKRGKRTDLRHFAHQKTLSTKALKQVVEQVKFGTPEPLHAKSAQALAQKQHLREMAKAYLIQPDTDPNVTPIAIQIYQSGTCSAKQLAAIPSTSILHKLVAGHINASSSMKFAQQLRHFATARKKPYTKAEIDNLRTAIAYEPVPELMDTQAQALRAQVKTFLLTQNERNPTVIAIAVGIYTKGQFSAHEIQRLNQDSALMALLRSHSHASSKPEPVSLAISPHDSGAIAKALHALDQRIDATQASESEQLVRKTIKTCLSAKNHGLDTSAISKVLSIYEKGQYKQHDLDAWIDPKTKLYQMLSTSVATAVRVYNRQPLTPNDLAGLDKQSMMHALLTQTWQQSKKWMDQRGLTQIYIAQKQLQPAALQIMNASDTRLVRQEAEREMVALADDYPAEKKLGIVYLATTKRPMTMQGAMQACKLFETGDLNQLDIGVIHPQSELHIQLKTQFPKWYSAQYQTLSSEKKLALKYLQHTRNPSDAAEAIKLWGYDDLDRIQLAHTKVRGKFRAHLKAQFPKWYARAITPIMDPAGELFAFKARAMAEQRMHSATALTQHHTQSQITQARALAFDYLSHIHDQSSITSIVMALKLLEHGDLQRIDIHCLPNDRFRTMLQQSFSRWYQRQSQPSPTSFIEHVRGAFTGCIKPQVPKHPKRIVRSHLQRKERAHTMPPNVDRRIKRTGHKSGTKAAKPE